MSSSRNQHKYLVRPTEQTQAPIIVNITINTPDVAQPDVVSDIKVTSENAKISIEGKKKEEVQ